MMIQIVRLSDPYLIFFNLLTIHDGPILKAVGNFIQDYSVA